MHQSKDAPVQARTGKAYVSSEAYSIRSRDPYRRVEKQAEPSAHAVETFRRAASEEADLLAMEAVVHSMTADALKRTSLARTIESEPSLTFALDKTSPTHAEADVSFEVE